MRGRRVTAMASQFHKIWWRWESTVMGKGGNTPKRLQRERRVLLEVWEKIGLTEETLSRIKGVEAWRREVVIPIL